MGAISLCAYKSMLRFLVTVVMSLAAAIGVFTMVVFIGLLSACESFAQAGEPQWHKSGDGVYALVKNPSNEPVMLELHQASGGGYDRLVVSHISSSNCEGMPYMESLDIDGIAAVVDYSCSDTNGDGVDRLTVTDAYTIRRVIRNLKQNLPVLLHRRTVVFPDNFATVSPASR